jgi:hypothetical protein
MKKKIRYVSIPEFCGIEYLTAKNVPVFDSKHGLVIDLDPQIMEQIAVKAVIEHGGPIRGREIHLFRSVLDLSMDRFGRLFDVSGPAILKWEKDPLKRLDMVTEFAVRMYMSEALKLSQSFSFTEAMRAYQNNIDHVPLEISLKRPKAS